MKCHKKDCPAEAEVIVGGASWCQAHYQETLAGMERDAETQKKIQELQQRVQREASEKFAKEREALLKGVNVPVQ